jgi:hypothetical protein
VHSSQEQSYHSLSDEWAKPSDKYVSNNQSLPHHPTNAVEMQRTPSHSLQQQYEDDEKQSPPSPRHHSTATQTLNTYSINSVPETSAESAHNVTRYLKNILCGDCRLQLDPCVNLTRAGTTVSALAVSIAPSTLGIYLAPDNVELNMTLDVTSIACTVLCMCLLLYQGVTPRETHCRSWLALFTGIVTVPVANIINISINQGNVKQEQQMAWIAALSAFTLSIFAGCSKMWHCPREDNIHDSHDRLLLEDRINKDDYMTLKLADNETKQLQIKETEATKRKQEDTKQLELQYQMMLLKQQQQNASEHIVVHIDNPQDGHEQLL